MMLAKAVLRAWEATDKRHIFITGTPGSGKSTLFRALVQTLGLTPMQSAVRPKDSVWLEDIQLGVFDPALPGRNKKMRPLEDGFRRAKERIQNQKGPWLAIDEVGYLDPPDYKAAILEKAHVLAVVRKEEPIILSSEDALVVDLDRTDAACVILASGLSRRFGSNKLLAELGGKPVIDRTVAAARGAFAKTVVVTRSEAVAARFEGSILHDLPHKADTIRLGVSFAQGCSFCAFLPGDQPLITTETLQALLLCARNEPVIWRANDAAPTIFPARYFPQLMALQPGRSGNAVIDIARTLPTDHQELLDADTPEDLAHLAKFLR